MSRPWSTSTRIVVVVIIFILAGLFAYGIQPLITPLIIAALLAYVMNLGVRLIDRRTRLTRRWSAVLVYTLFIMILVATPGTLVPLAVRQGRQISAEFDQISQQIESFVDTPIMIIGRPLSLEPLWEDVTSMTTDFGSAFGGAVAVVETTSANIIRLVVIIVTSYYLLMDWKRLRDWFLNLLPPQAHSDLLHLLAEIDLVWRAYMQGTLALMIIVGVVFTIIGLAIGLPGAVGVGIMTGFLSMIPEVGPWISGIIATIIAFFAGSHHLPLSHFWFAVLVGAIYLVLMQVKSIWLRPQVMGRFMRIHTGVVFLAIIGAAMLQGILAALIVLPILATIGVIGRYVRARLMNLEPWPEIVDDNSEESAVTPSVST